MQRAVGDRTSTALVPKDHAAAGTPQYLAEADALVRKLQQICARADAAGPQAEMHLRDQLHDSELEIAELNGSLKSALLALVAAEQNSRNLAAELANVKAQARLLQSVINSNPSAFDLQAKPLAAAGGAAVPRTRCLRQAGVSAVFAALLSCCVLLALHAVRQLPRAAPPAAACLGAVDAAAAATDCIDGGGAAGVGGASAAWLPDLRPQAMLARLVYALCAVLLVAQVVIATVRGLQQPSGPAARGPLGLLLLPPAQQASAGASGGAGAASSGDAARPLHSHAAAMEKLPAVAPTPANAGSVGAVAARQVDASPHQAVLAAYANQLLGRRVAGAKAVTFKQVLAVLPQAAGAASGAVRVLAPGALVLARVGAAYVTTAVVTWLLAGAPPLLSHRDTGASGSGLAAVRALADVDFMPAVLLSIALVSGAMAHQLAATPSTSGSDDDTAADRRPSGDALQAAVGNDASPSGDIVDRLWHLARGGGGFGRTMLLHQRRVDHVLAVLLSLVDNVVDPCTGAATLLLALHAAATVFSGGGAGSNAAVEHSAVVDQSLTPRTLPPHILRVHAAVLACEGLLALRRFVVLSRSISALQAARSEAMRAPFDASLVAAGGPPASAAPATAASASAPAGASALLFINDVLQRARAQRVQIVAHAVATGVVVAAFIAWVCGGGRVADDVDAGQSTRQHMWKVALPAAVMSLAIVRVATSSTVAF